MKIRTKLILLLILPLLAVAWMGFVGYRSNSQLAHEMSRIEDLTGLAVHISALVHETQKERGLTAGYYGSRGQSFTSELDAQRGLVDEQLKALQDFLAEFDRDGLDATLIASLDDANARLDALSSVRDSALAMSIPAAEAIGYYSATNGALLDTIGYIAQQSTDSEITSHITAYQSFLKGKERAGIERAVLSNTFAADAFGPGMYNKFIRLVADQDTYFNEFSVFADAASLNSFRRLEAGEEFAAVQAYREKAAAHAATGGFGLDAKIWFGTITQKINKLKSFEDGLSAELLVEAGTKRAEASRASFVFALTTLAMCLVAVVCACLMIRSVLRPLRNIIDQLKDCAEGKADLTRQADASRRDEIGELASWFNVFTRRIHDLVAEVAQATNEVASASSQIASSSEDMSLSTKEQALQITQVSAAVKQMAASVVDVSRKAADAANSAGNSGRVAGEGGAIVQATITGMQSINQAVSESAGSVQKLGDRGEQIDQVITVINDIAEQTNLLALNAAIEAARAGEHGRGFAVVADEVRKLADRTTQATEEIARSIQAIQDETQLAVSQMTAGQEQIQGGMGKATEAGESLREIVGSANEVASMIHSIAAAAEEQSAAAEEVSRNIQTITHIADESSAGITQSSSAANELSMRAEGLLRLVSQFKLHSTYA